MNLLARISSPMVLRRLARPELRIVADELRAELIRIGSEVGGHFAGSLGTVELTVALHYLMDTPHDRLVWDVGHQAYGHKALTGRLAGLMKVKKADGPSGFLRREESPYDAFGAGHAGTSVSAALGMVEAARRSESGARVVAIIGDGAATSGMSFEALNHAGHLGSELRVVFNDNGMSIAPNVGGLSRTKRARAYFEALGLAYLGPIDGHDLDALLTAARGLSSTRPLPPTLRLDADHQECQKTREHHCQPGATIHGCLSFISKPTSVRSLSRARTSAGNSRVPTAV